MEKFRAFLEVLKKYHFWVLCGLIVLLSAGSWYVAISSEEGNFAKQKSKYDSKLSMVQKIANTPQHPSREYINKILSITSDDLAKKVAKASELLYNEQQSDNKLAAVFTVEEDQKQFEAAFMKIWGPMEKIAEMPPGTLQDLYRRRYRDHIKGEFPRLFQLIDRRTRSASTGAGAAAGPTARPTDAHEEAASTTGIVDWKDADEKIDTFLRRYTSSTPTTLEIMMAQEDLWIYKTLLTVIHNTNNVSTETNAKAGTHEQRTYVKPESHKKARIKQILAMDIGKDAADSWAKSEKALFNLPGDAGGGITPPSGNSAAPVQSTSAARPSAGSGALAGRYVDDKGKALLDATQQPYKEFRMMPIDLKVVIEQKEIPRLLAECANSAMRIDVRAVRVLAEDPSPADLGASGAAASAAAGSNTEKAPSGSHATEFGMGHDAGAAGGDSESEAEGADPIYPPVPVEVQGIIYIYNPPAQDDSGKAGENGQAAPAATGNPTASPPAKAAGTAAPATTQPVPHGGRP
jgi:hypothetical protein